MLYKPCEGEGMFKVSLYNKYLRSLVKKNQDHQIFEDYWANSQKHPVIASDEVEARRVVSMRLKSDDGFVIEAALLTAF